MCDADVVFLAHFTGGGIDSVLDLEIDDYFAFLDESVKLYREKLTTPRRVVVAGFEEK